MRYRNAFPKYPRAMHLFLLILFLWKTTEQAYVDERHMEAFLEGSLDGITRGLKGTVNQTIETKLEIVETNLKEKFNALEESNKEKIDALEENNTKRITALKENNTKRITALEESNKEKIAALVAKFTALEEKNKEKITALEEKNREKITALEAKFTALEDNNKGKITTLEEKNRKKIAALEQERIKDLAQIRKEMKAIASLHSVSTGPGSIYKVSIDKKSWTEARELCEFVGSHLVTIDSVDEHNTLLKLKSDNGINEYSWIGGNDIDNEGTWKWVGSNTVIGYTNWESTNPNGGTSENCAALHSNTWWYDRPCTSKYNFICEKNIN